MSTTSALRSIARTWRAASYQPTEPVTVPSEAAKPAKKARPRWDKRLLNALRRF